MKQQTCVSLVEETLRTLDEFVSAKQIMDLTSLTSYQVSASLHHLRKHGVADVVVQAGLGWWYALPRSSDLRAYKVPERAEEKEARHRTTGHKRGKRGARINRFKEKS